MPPLAKAYLDATQTIIAAKAAGMSVSDFVEKCLSKDVCPDSQEGGVGQTRLTIKRLLSTADLPPKAHCLEIGPGTGRYFAELSMQRPYITCEYYETDPSWAAWLGMQYASRGLVRRSADGLSLSQTPSRSVDLCSAHGVFVYLDTMVTFNYLKEMARCVKEGGYLFFDILDTDREDMVDVIEGTMTHCNYLIPVSRRVVLQYLSKYGVELVQQFNPWDSRDISTYLLLRRTAVSLERPSQPTL